MQISGFGSMLCRPLALDDTQGLRSCRTHWDSSMHQKHLQWILKGKLQIAHERIQDCISEENSIEQLTSSFDQRTASAASRMQLKMVIQQ
jgi:hypothetical protein